VGILPEECVIVLPAPSLGPTRISVQALVHATEDESKVVVAIHNLFPESVREALKKERHTLRGHFHNPIIRLNLTLSNSDLGLETFLSLKKGLSAEDCLWLRNRLEVHVSQKGELFLRFDKQEAYQGKLRLINQGDSLRMAITFPRKLRTLPALRTYLQEIQFI
jgi:RNA binding exosome subunit